VRVTENNGVTAGGVTVVTVEDDSPAGGAGIRSGDVITAVDGARVSSLDDLQAALHGHSPGDRVRVTWTDATGTTESATVQLAGP
jgi:S1-C subfamily serine protease